ncbi:MAG: efflux RND transporter periplasmic adaptor subunit [Chloroflexota bacterium]|nr:efflux RND transporter periplasmic adaptor subunit [Chloroflexota bacterium]
MHINLRRFIPITLLIAIAALVAWWYFGTDRVIAEVDNTISASGTIEATQIILSPEIGGKIMDVFAREGDNVTLGQPLVVFEDRLLQAQWEQAQAAVELAHANYSLIAAGLTKEDRLVAIAAVELELVNAQQTLDELHDTAGIAAAQANQAVALADKNIDDAQRRLNYLLTTADDTDIDIAKAEVALAEKNLERAEDAYKPWANKPEDNLKRAQLLSKKAAAVQQYDAAVRKLNALEGTGDVLDIAVAESNIELAQAQLDEARRLHERVKDGPDPDALALAQAQLGLAQAHLTAAKAEPSPEQLAVAQAQVDTAQAASKVIEAQLDKLVLTSPIDGIVLVRTVEPGEVVQPGASLMTLALLDELTITVYVPEDRYGLIRVGQTASVTVDSFPGETFTATVTYIANQAEFTPRNVQTAEGRTTTVFAVKLAVNDKLDKLKPGMPADVVFK